MNRIKKTLFSTAAILLSMLTFGCSSNYLQLQSAGEIKFGSQDNQIRYTARPDRVSFSEAIPDDIEADNSENIYIAEKYGWRILKFSPNLQFISAVNIPPSLFPQNRSVYRTDVTFDAQNNLYMLVTSQENYVNLLKFDNSGKIISDFNLSEKPVDRCTGIFVSSKGKIFITTFPTHMQDVRMIELGPVYVYDTQGKFLGRTDYSIEDKNGNAIKRNLHVNDYLQLERYRMPQDPIIKTSAGVITDTLKSGNESESWHFMGLDSLGRVYFSQGVDDIIVRRFDFSKHAVDDIKIRNKVFHDKDILFRNVSHNICLAPSGNLYLCGVKTELQHASSYEMAVPEFSVYSYFNLKDLSIELIKMHNSGQKWIWEQ